MAHLISCISRPCLQNCNITSSFLQLRWRKTPCRKPSWLPTAKSKVFRIPVHPYVSPEEKELVLKLCEEYYRKIASIRKLFKAELEKKSNESILAIELVKAEEIVHERLMEENRKENERVKKIREETIEKEFKEKAVTLLQQYEKRLEADHKKKEKIERMILLEEEKSKTYVTYENLDDAIEHAMDNPININFCIDTKGNIIWEGTPPKEYEEYVNNRLKHVPENYYGYDHSPHF